MQRRDFIAKGALISSGVLASSVAIGAGIVQWNKSKKINIAIIGTGDRGGGLIPVLQTIEGFNIYACCDILPFRLENGMNKAGNQAKAFSDYHKLLNDKNVDAVLIAVPFNIHSQIAMDAVNAGKHVYCEKTLAKDFLGIAELVEKVSQSDKVFQTGHQYHSSHLYQHVVELIKSGEIGEIASFECQWNRNGDWRRSVPDPTLERAINWRMYREYSGGMAAELCSHQIDFITWVLGENPKKIMGVGGIDFWKDGRETFDNIHLLFEYPSGVKAKFTCLTNNSLGDYQIKVLGSKGTISLGYTKAWISYEEDDEKELTNVDGVSGATTNSYQQQKGNPIEVTHLDPSKQALVDFRDNIIQEKLPISNVYTGANTAIAVQMSLDAMINEEIQYWQDSYTYTPPV